MLAEALGLWSFRLFESWVIYKNLNICDHDFRFLEIQKFKTSWVLFNHWRWRSAMVEGAGAGLMQQSGQDLASWKCFPYIYCARGGKSWLCRTYRAHRVHEDTLLEANRFEGGHHRQHDGKTHDIASSAGDCPRAYACASCDVYCPRQNMGSTTCSQPMEHNLGDPRGDLWCGCGSMFWRRPYYATRCTDL